ncbi:hypothetical protein KIPB_006182 [Kipferlia bialata]|uniref:tRNA:m(4)X modification enzyme TRM13 n=1 Tax=Kipferlia bialata TaxID=797122 RepID=A0A9K3CWU3_9EUKA|nr:hypothetical protein KIPB_006182 [Kipferlia bialata]|eukprot:g6182.t1
MALAERPYYRQGCNLSQSETVTEGEQVKTMPEERETEDSPISEADQILLREREKQRERELMERVEVLHKEVFPSGRPRPSQLYPDHALPLLDKNSSRPSNRKHTVQNVSLAANLMEALDRTAAASSPSVCVTELGCGRANLSAAVGHHMMHRDALRLTASGSPPAPTPVDPSVSTEEGGRGHAFVLIDRMRVRRVADRRCGFIANPERIHADIADVDMSLVQSVSERPHLLGVAKHLCGCATDIGLRMLLGSDRIRALAVAPCCHHRCQVNGYLGKGWLEQQGMGGDDLPRLFRIAQWQSMLLHPSASDPEVRRKGEAGRQVKDLLDHARCMHIRTLPGLSCELVDFVTEDDLSLERRCILAWREEE